MTTNFGGVDVVPLAEWTWCRCRVPLQCALVGGEGDDQLWRSGRGTLITQKLVFAIWGLCWYNF